MTTASEIMTEDVTTINADASLADALQLLAEIEVRHLPVLDDGELVGMLSDRDVRSLGLHVTDLESLDQLRTRTSTPVSDVMSGGVISIGPATEVSEIIDLMLEEKVGAVPVVDEESTELVGMVSYVDVLRALRDSV
jgi:CBS domain-containing membrane protein